eukprot:727232-Hanusia_phi.AAC.1
MIRTILRTRASQTGRRRSLLVQGEERRTAQATERTGRGRKRSSRACGRRRRRARADLPWASLSLID